MASTEETAAWPAQATRSMSANSSARGASGRRERFQPKLTQSHDRGQRVSDASPRWGSRGRSRTNRTSLGAAYRKSARAEGEFIGEEGLLAKKREAWLDGQGPGHTPTWASRRFRINPPKDSDDLSIFPSNRISRRRYKWWSFVPRNLFEQFHRFINAWLLLIILLQISMPVDSNYRWYHTFIPFGATMALTAMKSLSEDLQAARADRAENERIAHVFERTSSSQFSSTARNTSETFTEVKWEDLRVSNIVRINEGELVPADLILLQTSPGVAYVDTAVLDADTKLKIKVPVKETSNEQLSVDAQIDSELPGTSLDSFSGSFRLAQRPRPVELDISNFVMRGSTLVNTDYVHGVVVFTGADTRLYQNTKKIKDKRDGFEADVNRKFLIFSAIVILASLLCTVAAQVTPNLPYVPPSSWRLLVSHLTAYAGFVPLSAMVGLDIARIFLGKTIGNDEKLRCQLEPDPRARKPLSTNTEAAEEVAGRTAEAGARRFVQAKPRNTNICRGLGQVDFIFADKTGTMTKNKITFVKCSVMGRCYDTKPDEDIGSHDDDDDECGGSFGKQTAGSISGGGGGEESMRGLQTSTQYPLWPGRATPRKISFAAAVPDERRSDNLQQSTSGERAISVQRTTEEEYVPKQSVSATSFGSVSFASGMGSQSFAGRHTRRIGSGNLVSMEERKRRQLENTVVMEEQLPRVHFGQHPVPGEKDVFPTSDAAEQLPPSRVDDPSHTSMPPHIGGIDGGDDCSSSGSRGSNLSRLSTRIRRHPDPQRFVGTRTTHHRHHLHHLHLPPRHFATESFSSFRADFGSYSPRPNSTGAASVFRPYNPDDVPCRSPSPPEWSSPPTQAAAAGSPSSSPTSSMPNHWGQSRPRHFSLLHRRQRGLSRGPPVKHFDDSKRDLRGPVSMGAIMRLRKHLHGALAGPTSFKRRSRRPDLEHDAMTQWPSANLSHGDDLGSADRRQSSRQARRRIVDRGFQIGRSRSSDSLTSTFTASNSPSAACVARMRRGTKSSTSFSRRKSRRASRIVLTSPKDGESFITSHRSNPSTPLPSFASVPNSAACSSIADSLRTLYDNSAPPDVDYRMRGSSISASSSSPSPSHHPTRAKLKSIKICVVGASPIDSIAAGTSSPPEPAEDLRSVSSLRNDSRNNSTTGIFGGETTNSNCDLDGLSVGSVLGPADDSDPPVTISAAPPQATRSVRAWAPIEAYGESSIAHTLLPLPSGSEGKSIFANDELLNDFHHARSPALRRYVKQFIKAMAVCNTVLPYMDEEELSRFGQSTVITQTDRTFCDPSFMSGTRNVSWVDTRRQIEDCTRSGVPLFNPLMFRGSVKYRAFCEAEEALVCAAGQMDHLLVSREHDKMTLLIGGALREFEIIGVNEWTAKRRRMSIVLREEGQKGSTLYCKGSPHALDKCLSSEQDAIIEDTDAQIVAFLQEGLRCVVIAKRDLSEDETVDFKECLSKNKHEELTKTYEKMLELLGAAGVRDELQEGVPETIHIIKQARIRFWMVTGDCMESALSTAYGSRLISPDTKLFRAGLAAKGAQAEGVALYHRFYRTFGGQQRICLLVNERDINNFLTSPDLRMMLICMAINSESVIAAGMTPCGKAELVNLVKAHFSPRPVVLAAGDGANDILMLQVADCGVGIQNRENSPVVATADFSVGQFNMLPRLILGYGRINYVKLSFLVLMSFFKGAVFIFPAMLFQTFCDWSANPVHMGIVAISYFILTTLALVISVVLNNDIPVDVAERVPLLYNLVRRRAYFNAKLFFIYLAEGLLLGAVCTVFVLLIFTGGSTAVFQGLIMDSPNYISYTLFLSVCLVSNVRMHKWMHQRRRIVFFFGVILPIVTMPLVIFSLESTRAGSPKNSALYFLCWPVMWFVVVLLVVVGILVDGLFDLLRSKVTGPIPSRIYRHWLKKSVTPGQAKTLKEQGDEISRDFDPVSHRRIAKLLPAAVKPYLVPLPSRFIQFQSYAQRLRMFEKDAVPSNWAQQGRDSRHRRPKAEESQEGLSADFERFGTAESGGRSCDFSSSAAGPSSSVRQRRHNGENRFPTEEHRTSSGESFSSEESSTSRSLSSHASSMASSDDLLSASDYDDSDIDDEQESEVVEELQDLEQVSDLIHIGTLNFKRQQHEANYQCHRKKELEKYRGRQRRIVFLLFAATAINAFVHMQIIYRDMRIPGKVVWSCEMMVWFVLLLLSLLRRRTYVNFFVENFDLLMDVLLMTLYVTSTIRQYIIGEDGVAATTTYAVVIYAILRISFFHALILNMIGLLLFTVRFTISVIKGSPFPSREANVLTFGRLAQYLPIMIGIQAFTAFVGYRVEYSDRKRFYLDWQVEQQRRNQRSLLNNVLPSTVVDEFVFADVNKDGLPVGLKAEKCDCVSVIFCDIDNFQRLVASLMPTNLVKLLDNLFLKFDKSVQTQQIAKIETVSETYLACAGLHTSTSGEEAKDASVDSKEIARRRHEDDAGRALRTAVQFLGDSETMTYEVDLPANESRKRKTIQVKIGINSGTVVCGVVGVKKPQYALFGDTINTASRMKGTGVPGCIHISSYTHDLVKDNRDFVFQARKTEVKGKGTMTTYLLLPNTPPPPPPSSLQNSQSGCPSSGMMRFTPTPNNVHAPFYAPAGLTALSQIDPPTFAPRPATEEEVVLLQTRSTFAADPLHEASPPPRTVSPSEGSPSVAAPAAFPASVPLQRAGSASISRRKSLGDDSTAAAPEPAASSDARGARVFQSAIDEAFAEEKLSSSHEEGARNTDELDTYNKNHEVPPPSSLALAQSLSLHAAISTTTQQVVHSGSADGGEEGGGTDGRRHHDRDPNQGSEADDLPSGGSSGKNCCQKGWHRLAHFFQGCGSKLRGGVRWLRQSTTAATSRSKFHYLFLAFRDRALEEDYKTSFFANTGNMNSIEQALIIFLMVNVIQTLVLLVVPLHQDQAFDANRSLLWSFRSAFTTVVFVVWVLFHYRDKTTIQSIFGVRWLIIMLNLALIVAQCCFLLVTSWNFESETNERPEWHYHNTLSIFSVLTILHHNSGLLFQHAIFVDILLIALSLTLTAGAVEASAASSDAIVAIPIFAFITVLSAWNKEYVDRQEFIKNRQMKIVQKRTDDLLRDMFPKRLLEDFQQDKLCLAYEHENMTFLFADICGFTAWADTVEAAEVLNLLQQLFARFDRNSTALGLYKLCTIGDAYVAVSEPLCSERANHKAGPNALRVIEMAENMIENIQTVSYRKKLPDLNMRIGLHFGKCVGGIIGSLRLRYDLWGMDVLTGNLMESNGLPGKIVVSEPLRNFLCTPKDTGQFTFTHHKDVVVLGTTRVKSYVFERVNKGENRSFPTEIAALDETQR